MTPAAVTAAPGSRRQPKRAGELLLFGASDPAPGSDVTRSLVCVQTPPKPADLRAITDRSGSPQQVAAAQVTKGDRQVTKR